DHLDRDGADPGLAALVGRETRSPHRLLAPVADHGEGGVHDATGRIEPERRPEVEIAVAREAVEEVAIVVVPVTCAGAGDRLGGRRRGGVVERDPKRRGGVGRQARDGALEGHGRRARLGLVERDLGIDAIAEVPEDVHGGIELAAREAAPDIGQDGLDERPDDAVDQHLDRDEHHESQPRAIPRSAWRKGSWWSKIAMRRSRVRPSRNAWMPVSMIAIILTTASTS